MSSCNRRDPGGANKSTIYVLCQVVTGRDLKEVINL